MFKDDSLTLKELVEKHKKNLQGTNLGDTKINIYDNKD
jgi:hypothetical protein